MNFVTHALTCPDYGPAVFFVETWTTWGWQQKSGIYLHNFFNMELRWSWGIPWNSKLRRTAWSPTDNESRQHNAQLTCQNLFCLLVERSTTKWALIHICMAQPDSSYCKRHGIWGINKNVKDFSRFKLFREFSDIT